MKLNVKMMLLFSAMMLAAVAILSSYSTQLNIDSFTDLSNQQFHNISHTVSEALDQQISLMDLVLEELLDNASFMAAINQFVRDDSDDQKVGTAARNTVLQLLYRSPLVENFYRVSFYTRSGDFVTSRFEKDDYLVSGTERAGEVISAPPPSAISWPRTPTFLRCAVICRCTASCARWYITAMRLAIWKSATNFPSWNPS